MRYRFIADYKTEFPVALMCRVLEVSRSAFYAWQKEPFCEHAAQDQKLRGKITPLFKESRCLYGSPRIYRELQKQGVSCSEKRVARLMREMDLAVHKRKRHVNTTDSSHDLPRVPNVLNRQYAVEQVQRVNQKWSGDITYIPTAQGWLYLAVVLDLKSRRVIGWSMADHMEASLVQNALEMATKARLPKEKGQATALEPLLFHSDQGSQYASRAYRMQLEEAAIDASMSRRGNCWDNAPTESFFATLKKEVVNREDYQTHQEAKASLFEYIEVFYNRTRSHSALGYISPVAYELSL